MGDKAKICVHENKARNITCILSYIVLEQNIYILTQVTFNINMNLQFHKNVYNSNMMLTNVYLHRCLKAYVHPDSFSQYNLKLVFVLQIVADVVTL